MKATTALSVVLAAACACGGGHKSAPAPAPATAAAPAPDAAPPQPPPGSSMGQGVAAARARSTFGLIPASARLVGGVSVAQARQSPSWPIIKQVLDGKLGDAVNAMRTACNIDLYDVVDTIEFGTEVGAADPEMAFVVGGQFTRAQVAACVQSLPQTKANELRWRDDGAATEFVADGETLWIGWPSANRFVVGPGGGREWVDARLAGRDAVRDHAGLMEVVGNVDTNATAWFAVLDESGDLAGFAGLLGGRAPRGLFLSARVADGAAAEFGFAFGAEADAKAASDALQATLDQFKADPMAGPLLASAHVGVYGTNAVVEVQLTREQLDGLIQSLGALPM
ncbi:MAG: hypothetical protein D6689_02255 [Deltaproteobacteria bacterium]|nr:MAG: hypothetical protein D6689_02255 [Deltaproteobacteria bacterium]